MNPPRVTLAEIFAAYWAEMTPESRKRHVGLWLTAWGKAIAAGYVRCDGCARVYAPLAWSELRPLATAPLYLNHEYLLVAVETRRCECGETLVSERKK